jgi:NitT/TauT family transport system ATP-binding protein
MLKIENLKKEHLNDGKNTHRVFEGFSLEIKEGEKVGLFGSNGSGKSTLLDVISGLDLKYKGELLVGDSGVSYVHQDTKGTLAPWFSCEKNIFLPLAYKHINIQEKKDLYKKLKEELEINFSLNKYPFELSGGQRQLVSVLRSILMKPDVLLLDEPFSAIDVDKREIVMKVFKKYLPETTVVICSHRGNEISDFIDRAIILEKQPAEIVREFKREKDDDFEAKVRLIRFAKNDK